MYRGVIKVGLIAFMAVVLIGLGLTAVVRFREQANRTRCVDNLRQVGWFALWHYADPDAAFPKRPDAPNPAFLPPALQLDPNRAFPAAPTPNPAPPPPHRPTPLAPPTSTLAH